MGSSANGDLRRLLEATRRVRREDELPRALDQVARIVSEALGFATVVINLYRPAWDDFQVATVYGCAAARDELLGAAGARSDWEPRLEPRFERHGAYFLPAGSMDLSRDPLPSFTPPLPVRDDPRAWHPEDALFARMPAIDGTLLGILCVDEPRSGLRPGREELELLAALGEHAALAVEQAQAATAAARDRAALEHLLKVSSRIAEAGSTAAVLGLVCDGIRVALGFQRVALHLGPADGDGVVRPVAVAGWDLADEEVNVPLELADVGRLLDPRAETEGCILLTHEEAEERLGPAAPAAASHHRSRLNGRGPRAWNRHWLIVPLYGARGELIGHVWADDPDDRLLPSRERLQALRLFANQATTALASAHQLEDLRFLAGHDPLTRLGNRRAFTECLEAEARRGAADGTPSALVLCDLDGFKELNDSHGHAAGDEALRTVGRTLESALRASDRSFRIGGDEFAMLLVDVDRGGAESAARRIGALLGEHALAASFGVAMCPADGCDPEALLHHADEQMYAAKRARRAAREGR